MHTRAFTVIEIVLGVILLAALVLVVLLSLSSGTDSGQTSLLKPSHELYQSK